MYKNDIYKVLSNEKLTETTYKMVLSGDTQYITATGQFINIQIDGLYLRRPISVCDYDDKTITIIYKVVGKGTLALKNAEEGYEFDVLTGLGNGYGIYDTVKKPLLVGGGVGVPPLYGLAKALKKKGINAKVILGFNTKDEVFYKEEFEALGCETYVATADGSLGVKGFVTDALKIAGEYDYFYSCGPEPMLKALYNACKTDGEFSFEERMGCGFGACMGCSCETKYGAKRICKDGPVLKKEEIVW